MSTAYLDLQDSLRKPFLMKESILEQAVFSKLGLAEMWFS